MNLKKIAVRGLIAVAVLVALCMFFSGTIENITTPKVKFARGSYGKLVENVELEANLAYPDTVEQRLNLPAGQSLTITRVNVRAGYPVKAGDVVIEATVTGYDAAAEQAQSAYDDAIDALMEVERKNEGLSLRRSDQNYADSYAALRSATREAARRRTDMEVLLRAEKLSAVDEGYPEGASDELKAAIDAYRAAVSAQDEAQNAFNRAARYGVADNVWAYISERQSAQEKADDCAEKLVELEELNCGAAEIRAPHDGVISEIKLNIGDSYDGNTALYSMTAEGASPVLRADLSDVERNVEAGMNVALSVGEGGVDGKVGAIGYSETGAKYCDVPLTDDMIRASGSLYNLSMNPQKLTLTFKSRESTCLLPASAVRGSGDERYVYTVNERSTAFGKQKFSLSKMDVKLLAEADGIASIQEDLSYYNIAYMEDRPLSDGSDVMQYVE